MFRSLAVISVTDSISPGGHSAPVADTTSNTIVLGYDTDLSSYVVAKFQRPLSSGDSQDVALSFGMAFTFSYAFSASSTTLVYHGPSKTTFSGKLDNGAASINPINPSTSQISGVAHGVILTVVWCFIADIAVLVKYVYEFRYRIATHVILMSICTIATAISSGLMIAKRGLAMSSERNMSAHVVLGMIVLVWTAVEALLGIVLRVLLCPAKIPPQVIESLRVAHKYAGYLLLFVAKAQVLLGWIMKDHKTAYIIIAIEVVIITGLRFAYIWWTGGKLLGNQLRSRDVVPQVESSLMKGLMERPYNDPEVQRRNIVIFDDRVYAISSSDFHPGGRYFIEAIKGREIDRFMYGLFSLEVNPKLHAFEHPKKSFLLLDEPMFELPQNPLCLLPVSEFTVRTIARITKDTCLLYWRPLTGEVKFQIVDNSKHLGQYFVVTGFGKTRLYTCVHSQTKANRMSCNQIVKMMTPVN